MLKHIRGGVCIYLRVRSALAIAAAMVLATGNVPADAAQSARGDGYPNRPIRYVVGGSVGGGADSLARAIGQKLGEQWGQQVIVDNRPGGGGIVASEIVAKSPPDGHTLLMAFTSHVTNPSLYPKLSYDAVKDFAPITLIATIPNILVVHPSLAADSVPALVALAKTTQLSFASTGSGASTHLAGVLFGYMSGTKLLHVPYKGAGPAITGVLMGETNMMFATMVSILPQVKSGKLRALAVTGARRSAAAPELPTISESGVPGYEANAWFATEGNPKLALERGEPVRMPPILYLQGTADIAHPVVSRQEFIASYRKAGGRVELHLFDGMSEAFITTDPTAPESVAAIEKIVEFVHRELA